MTLDISKVQENTNIAQNDSILVKPTEDNKGTVKVSGQNVGMEGKTPANNENICTENVENDPNITNTMIDKLNDDNSKESMEGKTPANNENICTENVENDPNITNTMIDKLNDDNSKESMDITNIKPLPDEAESDNETEELVTNKRKSKKSNLFHSDSENEEETTNKIEDTEENSDNETAESEPTRPKKLKRIAIIDSDSEDEVEENSKQDSVEEEVMEYKSVDENDLEEENNKSQKKILSKLCDSESSDENNEEDEDKVEEEMGISDTELEALQSNNIMSKSRKGKQKSENKEEKMTAKKALEERKEILAESQRRVRESRVSLPYHKPKARSLKEFLQNRPKLAAPLRAVSQGHSPSLAIKMSMKQLEVITQKMKEREKEVQEFYKSESESEAEEETKNESIDSANVNEINNVCNTDVNLTDDLSMNELLIKTDNNSEEMMDFTDTDKIIVENTDKIEITENENNTVIDEKIEEICEKIEVENTIVFESSEEAIIEESEKNTNLPDNDEKTESNENPAFGVDQSSNVENSNPELEIVNKPIESAELIENEIETNTESNEKEKIILISDIVLKPTEQIKSKNIYNLDDELLELASEVRKDEMNQDDNYEFNLDDIEDESELLQNGENSRKNKITKDELKRMKLEILEKVGIVQPRLSVGPNEIIDLEKGIAMPDEISRLRERFIRHNLKSEKHKHKKEISVMSVSDGQILKETLSFKTDENEDEDTKPLEKPGVRLQKLREELQHQMSLRRSDLWKEKLTKKSNNGNENGDGNEDNEEKSECDAMDILDNEDEEDFTDPEEDEEELEENDCDMSEKKKTKSDFVDEEAEESEIEENEEEEVLNEEEEEALLNNDEEEDNDMMNEEEEADVEDNEEEENEEADIEELPKKKVLKRIIKAFVDDSDDEHEEIKTNLMFEKMKTTKISEESASENLLSSLDTTNFKIREPVMSSEKSKDHFSTPVTYMTGLKNLNTSGSRFVPPENTQDEENTQHKSQILDANDCKNTAKISENVESQVVQSDRNNDYSNSLSTQDVMAVCSAEFPSSSKPSSSPEISTQQLREVFTGSMKSSCTFNTQDIGDICSGSFTGATQTTQTQEKEVTLDDKDEHLISQLIDEDELENFKKKFESPGINSNLKITKSDTVDEVQEVIGTGGVIDSDDEETGLKLKNRKRKRLAFSDDEESSTSETAQEETIDLHDDEDEEIVGDVEYDSEENEIEHNEEEEPEKKKLKASDFFENEAELSESEWGSADEDERNLDDLEFEKGDEEDFDQDKLRTDIEKLQMKQMLDEDNREVKMLQELLLEDGELHGTGRQRQFRWKNIDAAGDENDDKKEDDDDVYLEEDESEEKWRKERHEREMLKLKKESQDEEDDLIIESQSLSFTHKSLKIKSQTGFSPQVTSSEVDSSPKIKQPFTLLNKRGSFLSRGEKILQKIAETSKVSFTNKNTNRIVFQTIDEDTKKRKASSSNVGDSTPVAIKKLRLSGLSPALNKNKPTIAKSLFEKILGD